MKKYRVILSTVIVLLFGFIVFKGVDYYQDRYVGSDYYFRVPEDVGMEIETIYDINGKAVDYGKNYNFKVINVNGELKDVQFTFYTQDQSKLLQPGEYVKVEASNQISLGEEVVNKEAVPSEIVDNLDSLN